MPRCQSAELVIQLGHGLDVLVGEFHKIEVAIEGGFNFLPLIMREVREEFFDCRFLVLHPPSIQARIMAQKSRLFAGPGSLVRI